MASAIRPAQQTVNGRRVLNGVVQLKHMKEINRVGLSQASGNFPVGSIAKIRPL